jgi:hypothetical protein
MGFIVPILSLGLSAVTSFAQVGAANAQAAATQEAARRQTLATYDEVQRQQNEVIKTAEGQISDRIRAANAELGSVRVMALERGVSGSTMVSFANTIGYLEGLDIARIKNSRDSNIAAGEAAKRAAQNGYFNTVTIAQNQKNVATTTAMLNLFGSGLQIGGNLYAQNQQLNAYRNTT